MPLDPGTNGAMDGRPGLVASSAPWSDGGGKDDQLTLGIQNAGDELLPGYIGDFNTYIILSQNEDPVNLSQSVFLRFMSGVVERCSSCFRDYTKGRWCTCSSLQDQERSSMTI